VSSGIELVQLDLNNVSDKKSSNWPKEAREVTPHFKPRIIINNINNMQKVKAEWGYFRTKSAALPTRSSCILGMIGGTQYPARLRKINLRRSGIYLLGPFRSVTTKTQ